jgi:hypothetical protein
VWDDRLVNARSSAAPFAPSTGGVDRHSTSVAPLEVDHCTVVSEQREHIRRDGQITGDGSGSILAKPMIQSGNPYLGGCVAPGSCSPPLADLDKRSVEVRMDALSVLHRFDRSLGTGSRKRDNEFVGGVPAVLEITVWVLGFPSDSPRDPARRPREAAEDENRAVVLKVALLIGAVATAKRSTPQRWPSVEPQRAAVVPQLRSVTSEASTAPVEISTSSSWFRIHLPVSASSHFLAYRQRWHAGGGWLYRTQGR